MAENMHQLKAPPIVEAVLDINCDLPPVFELTALEAAAREVFRDKYPKFNTRFLHEFQLEAAQGIEPQLTKRQGIQAFQFLQDDGKQLLQVRLQGFSFNRLSPYTDLDDYLPEIERTWRQYCLLAKPVLIREIRLRYINRILLPMAGEQVNLDDYLTFGVKLPDEDRLMLTGFLVQQNATERSTSNQVNITLAAQPHEDDKLPLILDIEAFKMDSIEPDDWSATQSIVQSLRVLKNLVFKKSLTEKCMHLFQQ